MDIQQQQQDKQHNNSQTQNIKESTARNIHAFSGLELSSIVESASTSKFEDIPEDKGMSNILLNLLNCGIFTVFGYWLLEGRLLHKEVTRRDAPRYPPQYPGP